MKVEIIKTTEILGRDIQVYGTPEQPLFLAKDVADWIEHSNSREMVKVVDEDEKGVRIVDTLGGPQELILLTEDGLYEVLMQSRKPIAKEFKKGVKQMLREMRTFGFTATQDTIEKVLSDPDLIIGLANQVKTEREKNVALQEENELKEAKIVHQNLKLRQAKPKVLFADSVTASNNSILVGELAKVLKQNGVDIGQNRLFEWLRENGYLCTTKNKFNLPTQRSMDLGLFEIMKRSINLPGGDILASSTTKVTGKGQVYFINKFLNERKSA